jgi:mono/diheme cytochrome c family protein
VPVHRRLSARALVFGGVLAIVPVTALAQPAKTSPAETRTAGQRLYIEHCASCHGSAGRGDGPAADSLRRAPSDLTRFSRDNGGVFPSEKTRRVIDGRGVAAHGSVEMPVWGSVFKATSPNGSGRSVQDRINAIVAYLESIQERVGHD